MKKVLLCLIALTCIFTSCRQANNTSVLIPKAANAEYGKSLISLKNRNIVLKSNDPKDSLELRRLAGVLQSSLKKLCNIELSISPASKSSILLDLDTTMNISKEGYKLNVLHSGISIKAKNTAGLFYGIQSLLQLSNKDGKSLECQIEDYPAFPYRGLHLDVSRHFMPVSYIKNLLDLMAKYKLNKFHWHLVDGGGWRFQSDSFPLLCQKAQARMESDWTKWWINGDRKFVDANTKGAYSHYYTKQDMRDIVQYAKDRYIDVLPEIEMPGHSNEIFFAYPNLKCINAVKNTSELCIGNPQTFDFIDKILDETMDIFPYEYIHIGGDEASKDSWNRCPRCIKLGKKLMAEYQKSHPHDSVKHSMGELLQSYCIKKAEEYLNSKGRKIIGWDEILEGGLAPGATVMSWRGESGGIKAAKMGHNVIMTPGDPLYFDFYQACPLNEPLAIGGYNTLKKVYAYYPVPKQLSKDEAKYILGAQANLWTEFVPNAAHAAYMTWPRAMALAEDVWTPVNKKDYKDFLRRVNVQTKELIAEGVNAFPLKNLDIKTKVDTVNKCIKVYVEPERLNCSIHYNTDGKELNYKSKVYDSVIVVKDSAKLKLQLFDEYKPLFQPIEMDLDYHKAIGKKVHYNLPYSKQYPAGGDQALCDGYFGSWTYLDKHWQGFTQDMDVCVDMSKPTEINFVKLRFMQNRGAWIYMPDEVILQVSNDNKNFKTVESIKNKISRTEDKLCFETFRFHCSEKARYVRIIAKTQNKNGEWLFCDEIVIY